MIGQSNKKIRSGKLQRALRNKMSDAEQALWKVLRGRQVSDSKFRRQHPFGDYVLDFVCLENKLIIEVDGGQHGEQIGYDESRTQKLQAAGFRVLRFWNNEVLKDIESVKERIWLVVQGLQSHPPPDLPLEGGGVRKGAPLKEEAIGRL
ncbi:MAG TPA: endonuclease domain-containing protein [Thermodesulfobacteriota bacterium]|nr:endonuclease domain-containing protein [Thermodesulfobacteriota bacterium]